MSHFPPWTRGSKISPGFSIEFNEKWCANTIGEYEYPPAMGNGNEAECPRIREFGARIAKALREKRKARERWRVREKERKARNKCSPARFCEGNRNGRGGRFHDSRHVCATGTKCAGRSKKINSGKKNYEKSKNEIRRSTVLFQESEANVSQSSWRALERDHTSCRVFGSARPFGDSRFPPSTKGKRSSVLHRMPMCERKIIDNGDRVAYVARS